jgi:predicted lipoprotein with Yx(FWY)xxD motif
MAPASPIATGSTSLGTVLTDARGLTLYYLTPEKGTHVVCTGGCAATWPPLRASTPGAQPLPAGVSGTLATVSRPDGTAQVTYNGWPLYHFARDTAPGSVRGQGIGGVWFVAKPGLAP